VTSTEPQPPALAVPTTWTVVSGEFPATDVIVIVQAIASLLSKVFEWWAQAARREQRNRPPFGSMWQVYDIGKSPATRAVALP
jgi:hypothetical protein